MIKHKTLSILFQFVASLPCFGALPPSLPGALSPSLPGVLSHPLQGALSPSLQGALPPPEPPRSLKTSHWAADRHNIRVILGLPLENRLQALSRYGPSSYKALKFLVRSENQSLSVRWKALTSLARLYPQKSRPVLEQSLKSRTWFLRNAALVALEKADPEESVRWAGLLMEDPALVVRTAAVQLITRHRASQYRTKLKKMLNAPESFYNHQSLWIRYHIVLALASFAREGEEPFFTALLSDRDKRVQAASTLALRKLETTLARL